MDGFQSGYWKKQKKLLELISQKRIYYMVGTCQCFSNSTNVVDHERMAAKLRIPYKLFTHDIYTYWNYITFNRIFNYRLSSDEDRTEEPG